MLLPRRRGGQEEPGRRQGWRRCRGMGMGSAVEMRLQQLSTCTTPRHRLLARAGRGHGPAAGGPRRAAAKDAGGGAHQGGRPSKKVPLKSLLIYGNCRVEDR